jgi:hypothetical protein
MQPYKIRNFKRRNWLAIATISSWPSPPPRLHVGLVDWVHERKFLAEGEYVCNIMSPVFALASKRSSAASDPGVGSGLRRARGERLGSAGV